ncbi:MAG: hypothetical protein LBR45_00765 [Bacteroidales bacterium]|nr:hypothetical protein [Bacteroidales bacterium]
MSKKIEADSPTLRCVEAAEIFPLATLRFLRNAVRFWEFYGDCLVRKKGVYYPTLA